MNLSPRVFLNPAHWIVLKQIIQETQGFDTPNGALGELRRLMADADKHKRFIIEVENTGVVL